MRAASNSTPGMKAVHHEDAERRAPLGCVTVTFRSAVRMPSPSDKQAQGTAEKSITGCLITVVGGAETGWTGCHFVTRLGALATQQTLLLRLATWRSLHLLGLT